MEYDETNRGVLFKNNKKETERHPDYTGKLNVEGVELYLSAWIKESKSGMKFMSLSLGKEVTQTPKDTVVAEIADEPISLEDIPF